MFRIIELAFLVLIVVFFITQIIIPVIRQTRLFPWFTREKKLYNELTDVNQQIVENEMEKEIKAKKESLQPEVQKPVASDIPPSEVKDSSPQQAANDSSTK